MLKVSVPSSPAKQVPLTSRLPEDTIWMFDNQLQRPRLLWCFKCYKVVRIQRRSHFLHCISFVAKMVKKQIVSPTCTGALSSKRRCQDVICCLEEQWRVNHSIFISAQDMPWNGKVLDTNAKHNISKITTVFQNCQCNCNRRTIHLHWIRHFLNLWWAYVWLYNNKQSHCFIVKCCSQCYWKICMHHLATTAKLQGKQLSKLILFSHQWLSWQSLNDMLYIYFFKEMMKLLKLHKYIIYIWSRNNYKYYVTQTFTK